MPDSIVLRELHELKHASDRIADEISQLGSLQQKSWREDKLQEAIGLLNAGVSHLDSFISRVFQHHDKPYFKRGIETDQGIAEIDKNLEIAALRALLTETLEPLWRLDDLSDGQDQSTQTLIARIKAI